MLPGQKITVAFLRAQLEKADEATTFDRFSDAQTNKLVIMPMGRLSPLGIVVS